jgi:Bacterial Ig domain
MRVFTSFAAILIIVLIGSQSLAQTEPRLVDQYENVPNGDSIPVGWYLYDSKGNQATVVSNTLPSHGTLTASTLTYRIFTYTPDSTFVVEDEFTFTAVDAEGLTSIVTVHLVNIWKVAKGTYVATVEDHVRDVPSGSAGLTLTADRRFTGVITHYGERWPILGRFSVEGLTSVEVDRIGAPPIQITIGVQFNEDGQIEVWGAFQAHGNDTTDVFSSTALEFPDNSPAAGSYTMTLPAESFSAPLGNGFVTGKVSKHGRVVFVGRIGDGQAFSFGTQIRKGYKAQFHATAGSAPRDRLYGNVQFPDAGHNECTGRLTWNKAPRVDGYFQNGFVTDVLVKGSRLELSSEEDTILDYSTELAGLDIVFSDLEGNELLKGALIGSTENTLIFIEQPASPMATARASVAEGQTTPQVTFRVKRKKGLFQGTLFEPGASGKRRNFSGVFLQHQNLGAGLIRFGETTGLVTLVPR